MSRKMAKEAEKKEYVERMEKEIKTRENACAVVEFEAEELNANHPEKEKRVEAAKDLRKETDERNEKTTKRIEEAKESFDKEIKDIDEVITEWTEGKRLVSKTDLRELSNQLIEEHVKHNFTQTEIKEAEKATKDTA